MHCVSAGQLTLQAASSAGFVSQCPLVEHTVHTPSQAASQQRLAPLILAAQWSEPHSSSAEHSVPSSFLPCTTHSPLPSHSPAPALQLVPRGSSFVSQSASSRHSPSPSQLSLEPLFENVRHSESWGHSKLGQAESLDVATQWPGSLSASQREHTPSQAASQQTPSTQKPESHSLGWLHASPSSFGAGGSGAGSVAGGDAAGSPGADPSVSDAWLGRESRSLLRGVERLGRRSWFGFWERSRLLGWAQPLTSGAAPSHRSRTRPGRAPANAGGPDSAAARLGRGPQRTTARRLVSGFESLIATPQHVNAAGDTARCCETGSSTPK